jgi:hypothetical protein
MGRSLRNKNYTTMKKAIIAITLSAFTLLGTATITDARPYGGRGYSTPANTIYVSGYRHGRPVYTEKIFIGYDCHGHPRFTYRQVYAPARQYSQPCRPSYGSYHNNGYHHGGYSQNHHGRSGGSVSFTFRR